MQKLHILKINGHAVLNFLDLQEHFSPWAIWEQQEAYASFVRVHSLPLTVWQVRENGVLQPLQYAGKEFWMDLLEKNLCGAAFPAGRDASECLDALLRGKYKDELLKENASGLLEQERLAQRIDEKLRYIMSGARLKETPEDIKTAILLLAICQLAEMDAEKQDFQRWTETLQSDTTKTASGEKEEKSQDHSVSGTASRTETAAAEQDINDFPQADRVALKARTQPYCYWYHTEDRLTGKKIRTVRIEAISGEQGDGRVTLLFYRPDGSQAQKVELLAGEYRDCTVSGGRLIGFLPTMSISETLCMARSNYHSSEIRIIPRNASEWILNADAETARKITSFSAGDNTRDGFLYIRNGRLIKAYYKPAENYTIRQKLDLIDDRLVEVRLIPEGYILLTEYGEVISSDPEWNGRTGVITLYPRNKAAWPASLEADPENMREFARDESGGNFAVRTADDRVLCCWQKGE